MLEQKWPPDVHLGTFKWHLELSMSLDITGWCCSQAPLPQVSGKTHLKPPKIFL